MNDLQHSELHDCCCEMYPQLRGVKTIPRRRWMRGVVGGVEQELEKGERDVQKLVDRALRVTQEEYGSILVIIGVAVLSAVIEYIVRKILERWLES